MHARAYLSTLLGRENALKGGSIEDNLGEIHTLYGVASMDLLIATQSVPSSDVWFTLCSVKSAGHAWIQPENNMFKAKSPFVTRFS